jgi:hypothetical protein
MVLERNPSVLVDCQPQDGIPYMPEQHMFMRAPEPGELEAG